LSGVSLPTSFRPADSIHAWETLRAGLQETPFLTLTGYGRQLVDFADKQVTEISCHGLGRACCCRRHTVIDIGGQDSKVIQLDEQGNLTDFLMNDKCAAGTGRFLELFHAPWVRRWRRWTVLLTASRRIR
jgi:predicted CoA-substrate-specific enzyme activase